VYPRNAASPERIAIGPVVQISDGAVQTSGVSVRVRPQGGAGAAGGGTVAYDEGVVLYTPTQAETNHASFAVIAFKTGCIPAAVTVVTTDSATPGTVRLAPVTHTSAVIPTVTTLTGHTAQTGDAFARLGAPVGASISADIATRLPTSGYTAPDNASIATILTRTDVATSTRMATYTQPAGFLDATFPSGTIASTTNITAGTITTASNVPSAGTVAAAVWDTTLASHATVGSTGAALAAAGGSGDPWATALPGSYGAGTAGNILGTRLDVAVSTAGGGLDAAGVRAAVGLASANLDTQLADKPSVAQLTARSLLAAEYATAAALADKPSIAQFEARTLASAGYATASAVAALPDATSDEVETRALNVGSINGSAKAAQNLALHAPVAVPVTFAAGGTTATAVLALVDGLAASSTDDVYAGRVLVFTGPTALQHQATSITSYDGATKTATFPALTTAPGADATAVMS